MRPVKHHSVACEMPTSRGRNQLLAASGTIPRLAKTKPNFEAVLARRMSMGKVIVTPTPTAAPLIAPITGFLLSKIRNDTKPPPSRMTPVLAFTSLPPLAKVSPPPDKSAPAQNARPEPVTMTARTLSSASLSSNAAMISFSMRFVNEFNLSGRFKVIVAICSDTS